MSSTSFCCSFCRFPCSFCCSFPFFPCSFYLPLCNDHHRSHFPLHQLQCLQLLFVVLFVDFPVRFADLFLDFLVLFLDFPVDFPVLFPTKNPYQSMEMRLFVTCAFHFHSP